MAGMATRQDIDKYQSRGLDLRHKERSISRWVGDESAVSRKRYDRVMKQLVYDPAKRGTRLKIVCFVSGSGTNYREIAAKDVNHDYIVFTNRPGCGGVAIARSNKHEVIELSHIPYLKDARKRYGPGNIPRNSPERVEYEQRLCALIESRIGREPDLLCLAGYDQWLTDFIVDRYYPRILNVHPGDTTKGYNGLHWVPSARAILAGDEAIRSSLFFVDKGEDTGPVLVQSKPLNIKETVDRLTSGGRKELSQGLHEITRFAAIHDIAAYEDFKEKAGKELSRTMELLCKELQEALKVAGDWKIYPFAVHDLIARGRVQIDDRIIYVDGREMPEYGYRIEEHG
jgi:phosphoribosylglycinamide formyltransferase-1